MDTIIYCSYVYQACCIEKYIYFHSCERNQSHVDLIVNKRRKRLKDARTEKLVICYSNLQMLCTLTNKTDDEAFNCWSNFDGEENLNDEAEQAEWYQKFSIQDTFKSTVSSMATGVQDFCIIVVPVIAL